MLDDQLMAVPPEEGPAAAGGDRAGRARDPPVGDSVGPPALFRVHPVRTDLAGNPGRFLAAGYNVNACTWLVASGASQVELVVIDWFRRWLGFPDGAGGVLTSGGSAASVDVLHGTFALRLCIINHNTT